MVKVEDFRGVCLIGVHHSRERESYGAQGRFTGVFFFHLSALNILS